VYDNLKFPLLTKDWTSKEELKLIQGIMRCGMGNWTDISSQYVESKTPKECEDHYFTFSYKSKEEFLPVEDDFIVNT